jgi:photosystem II stability/assembly factor-like uncharacterized protein
MPPAARPLQVSARPAPLLAGLAVALAVLAQDPPPVVTTLTLFAGLKSGLWRTLDWGQSWRPFQPARSSAGLPGVGTVRALLPVGPWVYLGGDGGLFRSEDFGESWARAALDRAVLAVLCSRYPLSDPTVLAGAPDGLHVSRDGGRTFAPTRLSGTPVHRLEWPGPDLLVGTGRGLYVSRDSTASFEGPTLEGEDVRALALSSFYPVDPVLFAGTAAHGVFRSPDGARSWAPAGLPGHRVNDLLWLGPILYAGTDGGLFKTEDLGRSWAPLGEGLASLAVRRFILPLAPASGAEIFAATERGLFHTRDAGRTWRLSAFEGESVEVVATFPAPAPVTGRPRRR